MLADQNWNVTQSFVNSGNCSPYSYMVIFTWPSRVLPYVCVNIFNNDLRGALCRCPKPFSVQFPLWFSPLQVPDASTSLNSSRCFLNSARLQCSACFLVPCMWSGKSLLAQSQSSSRGHFVGVTLCPFSGNKLCCLLFNI